MNSLDETSSSASYIWRWAWKIIARILSKKSPGQALSMIYSKMANTSSPVMRAALSYEDFPKIGEIDNFTYEQKE